MVLSQLSNNHLFTNRSDERKKMMRMRTKTILTALVVGVLIIPVNAIAKRNPSTAPVSNQGQKWRIGYYEGGSYVNYPINLKAIVAGLVELGWIAPLKIPIESDETASKPVWNFLVQNAQSEYLEFVADGYWSAGWSKEQRQHLKKEIIERLNRPKEIDFMIAMGTWAGQDLSNDQHQTPTMAVSISDPVRSGISATAEDSGLDHFHAKCDPTRYIRQIRLFHRLINFKKLGVVYENTVEGKTYAALDDIYQVAGERKFSVVTCEAPFSQVDKKASTDRIIECHQKLSKEVDAVFVTVHRGIDSKRMQELVEPFLAHKIPTWSQRGPTEVKAGVLFSISRGGFKSVGKYHAEVMARVFNGETPRQIDQIFQDPKLIAVNMRVAERIGITIPDSILRIADDVYDTIEE
jgi:ABC-type uncharacterized transport system substrate-binding protein